MRLQLPFYTKLILFALILTSGKAISQSQYTYFKINPYYALPAGKSVLTEDYTLRYSNVNDRVIEDYKALTTSMGQGFGVNATVGKMVHPNFGIEVSANYLFGDKKESVDQIVYYSETDRYTNTYRSKCFSVIPAVVFHADINQTMIYSRTGMVFGFASMTQEMDGLTYDDDIIRRKYKFTGDMSLGFNTSLGIEIAGVGRAATVFAEVSFTSLNFFPEMAEMTLYTYNGLDSTNLVSDSRKYTEYSAEHSNKYEVVDGRIVDDIDPDEPTKRGMYQVSFGNVGFSMGVRFNLYADKNKSDSGLEQY